MKRCPKCGASLNDDDNFCLFCGENLSEVKNEEYSRNALFCEYCKNPVKSTDKFCPNCGMEIKGSGANYFNEGTREQATDEYKLNNNEQDANIWLTIPKFFKNIFKVSGRSSRRDYWFPRIIIGIAFSIIMNFLPTTLWTVTYQIPEEFLEIFEAYGIEGSAIAIDMLNVTLSFLSEIIFIPIMIRRIRDTGRSPWYILVSFIPLIGEIWLLIILLQPTDRYKMNY